MRISMLLEQLGQDLRYALRAVRRNRRFTLVTTMTLALAIGANTAIFTLIDTVMLRLLPVHDPGQLVELLSKYPGEPRLNTFPWRVYEYFRDQNQVFSDLIAESPQRLQVRGPGDAETVDGAYVAGNYFSALGVKPALGRLIEPQDDRPGSDSAIAIVSWSYWTSRFNRDPGVLGKAITIEGVPVTIVGIAPIEFFGLQVGARCEMWLPAAAERLTQKQSRVAAGTLDMKLMGRLKPGVSIDRARAEMSVLNGWRVDYLAQTRKAALLRQMTIEVAPAGSGFAALRDQFAAPLLVLMAAVGLLLLIACINVASMLLARGAARQRELAVRVALGAARSRLLRQTLTEALLLSAVASVLGVVLASLSANALAAILTSGRGFIGLPQHLALDVTPDTRVLFFTAGLGCIAAMLFGTIPAWSAFVFKPAEALRESGRAAQTPFWRFFAKALVAAQVALSVVLLSAAQVFVAHLTNLRNANLGFQRDSVLLVTLDPAQSGYQRSQLARLYETLLARLQTVPGVRSATLSAVTPIEGPGGARFITVEGYTEKPEERRYVSMNSVAPKYFETFGTPLIAGRDFRFDEATNGRVAIVNRAMATYYFGDQDPIGRRFRFDGQDRVYEIVGVAGDAKYQDLHAPVPRTIYLNVFQEGRGWFSQFALRTAGAPEAVLKDVRRVVRDDLKNVPVAKVTTLSDQVDASIVPERLIAALASVFGGLGGALAAVGLYGLLAYTIARRVTEIGVRMALGATQRNVTGMVLRDALTLVGGGLLVGVPAAFVVRRFVTSLVGTSETSAATSIAFGAVAMVVATVLAAYVPARRAARIDPMNALRQE